MHKFLLPFLLLLLSPTAFPQAQMDLKLRLHIEERKQKAARRHDSITVVVQISDEAFEEASAFARPLLHIANAAYLHVATTDLDTLGRIKGVDLIKLPAKCKPLTDISRQFTHTDPVHQGQDLPQPYDGTGVTIGIVDEGFDVNHTAFTDDNGDTRIRAFSAIDTARIYHTLTDPAQIASAITDLHTSTHGTHVASIAAGREAGNGYGGMAPKAGIILTSVAGQGFNPDPEAASKDEILSLGVDQAIKEARKTGQPFVINVSLATDFEAHDGKDPESVMLRQLAGNAIVIIGVGNAGNQKACITHTFTHDGETICTLLSPILYQNTAYAKDLRTKIWSDDNQPFETRLIFFDKNLNTIDDSTFRFTQAGELVASTGKDRKYRHLVPVLGDECTITVEAKVENYNNRYSLNTYVANSDMHYTAGYGEHILNGYAALLISGRKGQRIDAYINGAEFTRPHMTIPGATMLEGTPDGMIANTAVVDNVITVGSCNSRSHTPYSNGDIDMTQVVGVVGDVSKFSSWCSDKYTCGHRPHIVAPGAMICAAGNGCNKDMVPGETPITGGVVKDKKGNEHYYVAMYGTSMATPAVTGIVALWLQANPELNTAQILEIMRNTSTRNNFMLGDPNPSRWGYGVINAYEGIKHALKIPTSVTDPANSRVPPLIKLVGNTIEITVPANHPCRALLYNAAGAPVAESDGDINVSHLPSGLYIVKVNGKHAQKIAINHN